MLMSNECIHCLYTKQVAKTDNEAYLKEVKDLLDNRKESSAPEIVYHFDCIHERYFGKKDNTEYEKIKSHYNQLVMGMEDEIIQRIESSNDPLFTSIQLSRIGNYIDFGAMDTVDKDTFFKLLFDFSPSELDKQTYTSFIQECEKGKTFLLLADNCGEIELDKLFVLQLQKRFPHLDITVMVRGETILNDATMDDAKEVELDKVCRVITNGLPVAGTVYNLLDEESKTYMDNADIIVAKGQGNFESVAQNGFHVFFSFLCKCDLFANRFRVEKLTGMFIEEK